MNENLKQKNRLCQILKEENNSNIINSRLNSSTMRLQATIYFQSPRRGHIAKSKIAKKHTQKVTWIIHADEESFTNQDGSNRASDSPDFGR